MKLSVLASHINGELIGDGDVDVSQIASVNDSGPDDLTFFISKKYEKKVESASFKAIISIQKIEKNVPQIIVKNYYEAMAKAVELLYPDVKKPPKFSSATHLDDSIVIGENVSIAPGAYIGHNTTIGANTIINPNVTIYPNSVIGANVIIHAGTVIGSDGFGYYQENGQHKKLPHIGRVVVGDDVEIGGNCVIDRGCLGDTVIGDGTKLDNLVHIAHNNIIGRNSAIAAQTGTMGGTEIGDYVMIAGKVAIESVKIGSKSIVLGLSGVTKDVPEGSVVSGFPAQLHRQELKDQATLRKMLRSESNKRSR